MTYGEALAFLTMSDRSRTTTLAKLNPAERTEVFVAILLALRDGPAIEAPEEIAA